LREDEKMEALFRNGLLENLSTVRRMGFQIQELESKSRKLRANQEN